MLPGDAGQARVDALARGDHTPVGGGRLGDDGGDLGPVRDRQQDIGDDQVVFELNRRQRRLRVSGDETLLATLRETFGLTSVRGTCGIGICGICGICGMPGIWPMACEVHIRRNCSNKAPAPARRIDSTTNCRSPRGS